MVIFLKLFGIAVCVLNLQVSQIFICPFVFLLLSNVLHSSFIPSFLSLVLFFFLSACVPFYLLLSDY
jgi:hypothetical protein